MTRIKKGEIKRAKHKKILKLAKGYVGARSKLFRSAKEAVAHAGAYAFAGRKARKRDFRKLWIVQINAFLKEKNISYNKFINNLKKQNILLDRKILADIAKTDPEVFAKILEKVKITKDL